MRRQRKKGGMRMDRIQKLLLLGAAALIIWFGFTLHDDWVHFNESLPMIMEVNHLQDLAETNGMFFSVVVFRGSLILIPAFIMIFAALVTFIRDHSVPGEPWSFWKNLFHHRHQE